MKVDPFAPQLLADYGYFCRKFGHLAFAEFVTLWHAADDAMQAAIDAGSEPHEVPGLIFPARSPGSTVH